MSNKALAWVFRVTFAGFAVLVAYSVARGCVRTQVDPVEYCLQRKCSHGYTATYDPDRTPRCLCMWGVYE